MNETETNSQGQRSTYPKLNLASKILGIFFTLLGGFLWMRYFIKTSDPDVLWNDALWGTISVLIGCGSFMLSTLTKSHNNKKRKTAILYVIVYAAVLILVAVVIYYIIDFFANHFL